MGVSRRKMISALLAAVMVLVSATGVFASEMSTTQGTSNSNKSYCSVVDGTIEVATSGKILSTSKGTIEGNTITGLKEGQTVKITTTEGTIYRWVKTTKIKKAKNGKVKWKKVKKAKYYIVKIKNKKGKITYKKVSKKKLSLKVKKGCKVQVRPVIKKNGIVYSGAFTKAKKVK